MVGGGFEEADASSSCGSAADAAHVVARRPSKIIGVRAGAAAREDEKLALLAAWQLVAMGVTTYAHEAAVTVDPSIL